MPPPPQPHRPLAQLPQLSLSGLYILIQEKSYSRYRRLLYITIKRSIHANVVFLYNCLENLNFDVLEELVMQDRQDNREVLFSSDFLHHLIFSTSLSQNHSSVIIIQPWKCFIHGLGASNHTKCDPSCVVYISLM